MYQSKNTDPGTTVFAVFADVAEDADRPPRRGRWFTRAGIFLGMAAVGIACYGLSQAAGEVPEMANWDYAAMDRGLEIAGNYGMLSLGALGASIACGVEALRRLGDHRPDHAAADVSTFEINAPQVLDWPVPPELAGFYS